MLHKADIHIHTVLSPCGDLDMSPVNIINKAKELNISILGITDHNSCRNAEVCAELGKENDIFVICGAEVTTKEEVHCLCFMPDINKLNEFQQFIDSKIIFFQNSPDKFGYQLVIDKDENIVDEVEHLLINAIDCDIKDLQVKVDELNGIFIPAHIDRPTFSISSQLGFIPTDLKFDVLELSYRAKQTNFLQNFPWFQNYRYIYNSDAHFINDIGRIYTEFELTSLNFENFRKAIIGNDKNNYIINK